MEEERVRISKKWLQQTSKGQGTQIDVLAIKALKVVRVQTNLLLCTFIVSDGLTDSEGNWHVGAIAILIEIIGGTALHSFSGQIKPIIDMTVSYFSSAKVHEEVEIEAKIIAQRGNLTSVMVEVRRKENGELIALGKMWAASIGNAARGSQLWRSINNKSRI